LATDSAHKNNDVAAGAKFPAGAIFCRKSGAGLMASSTEAQRRFETDFHFGHEVGSQCADLATNEAQVNGLNVLATNIGVGE
jgi:hypothetical protein